MNNNYERKEHSVYLQEIKYKEQQIIDKLEIKNQIKYEKNCMEKKI
jgi:hypothetical protein